jgi:predicted porin
MNTVVLAAATAAALLSSPSIHAQSSFVLYGTVDLGINLTSDRQGERVWEMRSGNVATSRWGLRGQENLGDGYAASFNLESGFAADTGMPSSATNYWNRQSWVGIGKQGIGQLRMGLQLPTISDAYSGWSNSTWFGSQAAALDGASVAAGASAARFNNMVGGTRVANAVKFTSSSVGGFKVGVMLTDGTETAGRSKSLSLGYGAGSVEGVLAWHHMPCAGSGCGAQRDGDDVVGFGANYRYTAGGLLGGFYTRQRSAKNVAGADADVWSLLFIRPLGAWVLMAGAQRQDDKTAANRDTTQLNLGVKYAFSKRTEAYSLLSRQRASGGGQASMFGELSSNGRQSQFNVGVRHAF